MLSPSDMHFPEEFNFDQVTKKAAEEREKRALERLQTNCLNFQGHVLIACATSMKYSDSLVVPADCSDVVARSIATELIGKFPGRVEAFGPNSNQWFSVSIELLKYWPSAPREFRIQCN